MDQVGSKQSNSQLHDSNRTDRGLLQNRYKLQVIAPCLADKPGSFSPEVPPHLFIYCKPLWTLQKWVMLINFKPAWSVLKERYAVWGLVARVNFAALMWSHTGRLHVHAYSEQAHRHTSDACVWDQPCSDVAFNSTMGLREVTPTQAICPPGFGGRQYNSTSLQWVFMPHSVGERGVMFWLAQRETLLRKDFFGGPTARGGG